MNYAVQDLLDPLLDKQKRAWLDGNRPSVEDLLSDSSLPNDSDVLLDLIYNEIVLREEIGENPSIDEYVERYPQLDDDLKLHFEVHRALQGNSLIDTELLDGSAPMLIADPILSEEFPTLAHYEMLGELGRGGMGVVYKARHRHLKRLVAVKMFHPGRLPSPRELARFRSEAETIARLQHPNIVQIFEVGEDEGLPFLILELVEKGSLAQKLQDLPLTPRAAAELLETLSRAIQHAHERHIVHRDIKPANVLLGDNGVPKITDFGLAKILENAESPHDATRSGETIGTPRYMAPEQAAGTPDEIGPGTDIYSLGTILFECMTGQVPFVSASVMETMQKIRDEEPVAPRRLQRKIPRDLETICLKCLHKQPARRYSSALDLAEDLRRFLNAEPIRARPTPTWERMWMWSHRHPSLATAIASCIFLIVAGVIALGVRQRREDERVAKVHNEFVERVKEGKEALARHDDRTAKEKFLTALSMVLTEPALYDQEGLGIRGWLDQALRDAEDNRWKLRPSPILFDERRDQAFLTGLLVDPRGKEGLRIIRAAIQNALAMTIADDPAWRRERVQLGLIDTDLLLRNGDAINALAALEATKDVSSRLWHLRRSNCLECLGRKEEAERERVQAEPLPPEESFECFLNGVDHYYRQDAASAVRDFDKLLTREPDHFSGRFFQAASFLALQRAGEAKVALTACIGQRPRFGWCYLFRGQACLELGEYSYAAQDFQTTLEMNPDEQALQCLDRAFESLDEAIQLLPEDVQEAVWKEKIRTDSGERTLRDLPAMRKTDRPVHDK